MASQSFVSDMQAMNATTIQQSVQASNNQKPGTTTIIQPAQAHSGQQFIVTTAVSGSGGQELDQSQETVTLQQAAAQSVYPAHVQQSYEQYGQATMYTPVSGNYFQGTGTVQMGGLQGQILTHQGGTYLVQGGTMDGEGHPLTHTTRASPATVQWLVDNFETCEGLSLPRATLYNLYMRHCSKEKLDPMSPPLFGKLIRSIFVGLRTRRLGTRNNSKYHYYGLRIKPNSPLIHLKDEETIAQRQPPLTRFKNSMVKGEVDGSEGTPAQSEATTQQQQHQQFLGDASTALPNFKHIDLAGTILPDGITKDHVRIMEILYKEHCEALLDVVVNLQFSLFEALWQGFWRNSDQPNDEAERQLPKEKLHALCRMAPVQKYIRRSDYAFYQALVEVLIPDVLRPIPSSLTQAIRNFAKSLEGWLKGAMTGVPDEMVKCKSGAAIAFAQTLRRYTSLNHLAQAARAVLQNTSQINQMLTDLNRVDFANVQEQASWVCQCEDATVTQLEQDFKKTLQQQNSLEQWASWLEGVVNKVLKPHEGSDNFPKAARQFLLKWSFYSSMVIRDLTLRSAASFGSFHLIRLLYDEYMFYLVEHKVASATGDTPIAVMGEVRSFFDIGSAVNMGTMETSETKTTSLIANSNTITINKTSSTSHAHVGNIINKPITVSQIQGHKPTVTYATLSSTPGTSIGHPTTVTVMASSGNNPGGTKTIVVVPVSSTTASGDGPMVKRLKTL
ncbi:unnamed protein product [Owenia fusiformis]|uniref:Uncharacterized protein n=1 Tax=Owenia fusiformis TaxID=6347 RepID=A0A8J1TS74_OWEFU|nr:unnamed protein product [Owenia fusiformis]